MFEVMDSLQKIKSVSRRNRKVSEICIYKAIKVAKNYMRGEKSLMYLSSSVFTHMLEKWKPCFDILLKIIVAVNAVNDRLLIMD